MMSEEELKNPWALEQLKVDSYNAQEGSLKGIDCPICKNKGTIGKWDGTGPMYMVECECMNKRRSLLRIEQSGLSPLLKSYTMDSYLPLTKKQYDIKNKAIEFADDPSAWFVIIGKPGTGKTHICTAICGLLIEKNYSVRYMLWRDDAPKLKAHINDRDIYDKAMGELKSCDVLYIDDFWKGNVTDADINLSFELLNSRYNNRNKITIISSEKSLEDMVDIDEAIGSRIWERSKGFRCSAPEENYRLR